MHPGIPSTTRASADSVRALLSSAAALRERLVAGAAPATWDAFAAPLEAARDAIDREFTSLGNLDATLGTPEVRRQHHEAQAAVTRHRSEEEQDERVWRGLRHLADSPAAASLGAARRAVLDQRLRNYRLAGVHLASAPKARLRAIAEELAALGSKFADNATDDAARWRMTLDRPEQVAGLPAPLVERARERGREEDPAAPPERCVFGLDAATFIPFSRHQPDRALREEMVRAWLTRASSEPYDNTPLVPRILSLRREAAGLLGFANYAEVSLVPKMARTPAEVRAFLLDLADRARPRARDEVASLAALARREDGISDLALHDVPYYRERMRSALHGFSQEDLRPWFPLPRAVEGLSRVLGRLYGISIADRTADGQVETWHPDVRVLEVSEGGDVLGHVLFDPCARTGKRAGAWVSGWIPRGVNADGSVRRPVALLVCNFPPAAGGRPPLLAHDEVRTLFHEFGHALHHVLSTVEEPAVSGTHGVPWDGVEFPSQFLENWIWEPESLALVSGHVDTGEPLSAETLAKLRASRDFLAATDLLRQVELALFDLELHTDFDPARDSVSALLASVRGRVSVMPSPAYDRLENSFLHVFKGAYAAGYYGYKWAEVLAADAFSRFEEEGIFSPAAARDFRSHVLAPGGSEDFMDLFVRFRGRAPDPSALLRQSGIA